MDIFSLVLVNFFEPIGYQRPEETAVYIFKAFISLRIAFWMMA